MKCDIFEVIFENNGIIENKLIISCTMKNVMEIIKNEISIDEKVFKINRYMIPENGICTKIDTYKLLDERNIKNDYKAIKFV